MKPVRGTRPQLRRLTTVLAALTLAVVGAAGPAAAAPALPTHLLTGYWQNFDNGATNLKLADVPESYGIVAVAFADAVPSQPGAITFDLDPTLSSRLGGYDTDAFKADIETLQSQGRKVVLSVGGEKGSISLPDAASADNFARTSLALMDSYGFDGVDIDLENAPNLTNMTSALRQISASAGSDFVLTMAPETLYVQSGGTYLALIESVKDLVTVVNTQYYNSGAMLGLDGKVYTQGTVDFQTALADILLAGPLRDDQVGLGLPAVPAAAGSGYIDPSVTNKALDCLARGTNCGAYTPVAKYPNIRGAMTWSVNWDASNGYNWSNSVGGHLASLPGGTGTSNPPVQPPAPPVDPQPPVQPPAPPTCGDAPAWTGSQAYGGGSSVSHQGNLWTARWWTQGDSPGNNAQQVWTNAGSCDATTGTPTTPGQCSVVAWDAAGTYLGGDEVSVDGRTFTAQWWTRGEAPGQAPVWAAGGAC